MPLTVFKRLGLEEPKPTFISLQLADSSIKHLRGIVKLVLVKIGKFIFLVDFIILDLVEDKDRTIIFGRPFLATRKTMINVKRGPLTF